MNVTLINLFSHFSHRCCSCDPFGRCRSLYSLSSCALHSALVLNKCLIESMTDFISVIKRSRCLWTAEASDRVRPPARRVNTNTETPLPRQLGTSHTSSFLWWLMPGELLHQPPGAIKYAWMPFWRHSQVLEYVCEPLITMWDWRKRDCILPQMTSVIRAKPWSAAQRRKCQIIAYKSLLLVRSICSRCKSKLKVN